MNQEITGKPAWSGLYFPITLLRAVLAHLYQRLSRRMPSSVEELLALKQEVLNALEEYFGTSVASGLILVMLLRGKVE